MTTGCENFDTLPESVELAIGRAHQLLEKCADCSVKQAAELVSYVSLHSLVANRALAQKQALLSTLVRGSLAQAGPQAATAVFQAFSDLAVSEEGCQALQRAGAISALLTLLVAHVKDLLAVDKHGDDLDAVIDDGTHSPQGLADCSFSNGTQCPLCLSSKAEGSDTDSEASDLAETIIPALLQALASLILGPAKTAIGSLPQDQSLAAVSALRDLMLHEDLLDDHQICALLLARLALEEPLVFPTLEDSQSTSAQLVGGDFQAFLLRHWERAPLIAKGTLPDSLVGVKGLRSSEDTLRNLIPCCTAVLSTPATELDVLAVLEQVKDELAKPMTYGQDATLVRCRSPDVLEHHKGSEKIVTATTCQEAYSAGFTLALRALHCRVSEVAHFGVTLGQALGQAPAGCNLYLTPPGAQGLAAHYDDHCVFVCQLAGSKTWEVYEPTEGSLMPRLYAPRMVPDLQGRVQERYLLEAGDVLYIPRGWVHKAMTAESDGASLHVTFGVEVEPPFDWEGFFHVSLASWAKRHVAQAPEADDERVRFSEALLHVALRQVANRRPDFRKACLVEVLPLASISQQLLAHFATEADFMSAFRALQEEIEAGQADGCCIPSWLDWLEQAPGNTSRVPWIITASLGPESVAGADLTQPANGIPTQLPCCPSKAVQGDTGYIRFANVRWSLQELELDFVKAKQALVAELDFLDSSRQFCNLLAKYRKARLLMTSAVLSLRGIANPTRHER